MDNKLTGEGRLARRRVIVTGAASGIGRAIAELFAQQGASLALFDINAVALQATASELGATAVVIDLFDTEALEQAVVRAAAALGGIDGIVNCAAYAKGGPIEATTNEVLGRFVAINLTAPYVICRAALPYLRQAASGTVVNIASGQGLLPNAPNNTAYAATKGGLIAFSKSLAAELAPRIRVNALAPGVTNTPMAAHLFEGYENPSEAPFVQQYALRRIAEPSEIADAALFLTSAESSYVTGIVLPVDGGRTFH